MAGKKKVAEPLSERYPGDELSPRKKAVLSAVVDDYVSTCEPVGSKALLAKHKLGVSPATIRNDMAELERLGYLEQPHTSAGRVPSDKGYRAYVNTIFELPQISAREQREISLALEEGSQEIRSLIQATAGSLADATQFTSLVLTPTYGDSTLKQVKILMIEPGKALVVVVLSAGVVRDRMIRISNLLTEEQLRRIAETLESSLAGLKLEEISLLAVTDAGQKEEIPEPLLNQVLYETYLSIKQAENIDVYMEGSHHLLMQPEFNDTAKAHRFLDTLSQNGLVAGYLAEIEDDLPRTELAKTPAFAVRIGQEIALGGMEDCSFVTTSYRVGDSVKGRIAVIGPRRMAYSKIISEVAFVHQKMNQAIHLLTGEGPEGEAE